MNHICKTCQADLCRPHAKRPYCPTCNSPFGRQITLPLTAAIGAPQETYSDIRSVREGDPRLEPFWVAYGLGHEVEHPLRDEAIRLWREKRLAELRVQYELEAVLDQPASETTRDNATPLSSATVLPMRAPVEVGDTILCLSAGCVMRVTGRRDHLACFIAGRDGAHPVFRDAEEGDAWLRCPAVGATIRGRSGLLYRVAAVDAEALWFEGRSGGALDEVGHVATFALRAYGTQWHFVKEAMADLSDTTNLLSSLGPK